VQVINGTRENVRPIRADDMRPSLDDRQTGARCDF